MTVHSFCVLAAAGLLTSGTLVKAQEQPVGAAGTKGSTDMAKADELLAKIDEIAKIFWETKQG